MKKFFTLFASFILVCHAFAAIEYGKVEYDFSSMTSSGDIVMSSTPYSASDGGNWGAVYVISSFKNTESAKLAFRYSGAASGNYSWWYRNNGGNSGLYHGDSGKPASLAILGLRAGDIVTITCTNNDNLQYVKFDGNVHAVFNNQHDDFHEAGWGYTKIISGLPIHITSDGDMILRNYGDNYIKKIEIRTIKNATYKITKNNNHSTTFSFVKDGLMDYNDVAVPYMRVSFGHSRNYITVNNSQSSIYDYTEQENLTLDDNNIPYSGNFYAFTPTGNGTVTLNGTCNGTVCLFKRAVDGWYVNNPAGTDVVWASYNNQNTITFSVENGYTYYICEDSRNTHGNAFHLQSFTFDNSFYLDALAVVKDSTEVVSGNTLTLTGIHGATSVTGTVKRASDNIDASHVTAAVSNGQLTVSGIAFKDNTENCGGTIILHIEATEGVADFVVTIPYSAGWGTWDDGYGRRTWGHVWHFADPRRSDSARNSTGLLEIGQAGDPNSTLAQEILKREWIRAQRITGEKGGFHDPMYVNVFDMEGDNADMIWETEGLWFETESNLSCLYNENAAANYNSSADPDHYVGLLPPETGSGAISSFTIPGLKDGDRVEIFLGSGEGSGTDIPYFNIQGAKDAIGTPIGSSDSYGFGGSMWDLSGTNNYDYRACYQFVKDGNGPMKFTLKSGSMAKIYSIHIYRGEKSYQNNVTRHRDGTDGYQLLNTYQTGSLGGDGTEYEYQLHYRGKGESLYQPQVLASEGVIDLSSSRLWYTADGHIVHYKSRIGDYGAFRMRLKCANFNGNYVADYADQTISVGYLEKMSYPYTWDFTDLKSWIDSYAQTNGLQKEWTNASQTDDNKWVYIWRNFSGDNEEYGLNANHNSDRNVTRDQIRTSGGQLYAGDVMLEETRGLGVETVNYDKNYNDRLRITSNGINISGLTNNTWTLRIPEVPANGAVYVRAKKLGAPDDSHAEVLKCKVGSGAQQDFPKVIEIANDETGESVFVVKNTSNSAQDVRLTFNQVNVKRIAVATDEKKVNVKGYASESRNHDIDAKLLPYFTGEDFKTYIVSNPDYDNLTLTLTDVGSTEANYVMKAYTGCVIRRMGEGDDLAFNVFNDGKGFHLFVPDMHDTTDGTNNKYVAAADQAVNDRFMIPVLSEMQVPYTNTGNYVTLNHDGYDGDGAVWYAFTWSNDQDGTWIPEADGMFTGLKSKVIFVRMNPNGMVSWSSKWNQTEDLTPQNGKTFTITGWDNGNGKLAGSWSDAGQATDMTNYVLTYNYKKLNGTNLSATISGEEKFYRVYSGWDIWLRANSAYLQLPTASVLSDGAPRAARMFSFFFADANEQATTAIDDIEGMATEATPVDVADNNAVWYNIYGQRLGSRPTQRGVYIVNGKKVTVK